LVFERGADEISIDLCLVPKELGDAKGSSFLGESLFVYLFLEFTPKIVKDLAVV
jgi:hypothetical protein